MAFSAVFQWKKDDEQGLNRFLLAHYIEHNTFYKTLMGQSPAVITSNYPIQTLEGWEQWLDAHQKMTQSVWSGLGGGQTVDFGTLKYDDEGALQDWQLRHSQWHATVRESLNL